MLLSFFSGEQSFSIYEFLGIAMIIGIIAVTLVVPVVKRKTIEVTQVLKASALISVVVASYVALTWGQSCIHSDTATSTLLTHSVWNNKSLFPKSWDYVNGEIWLLNNALFVSIPTLILKNQVLARAIGSLLFFLTAVFSLVYQSKKSFNSNSWTIAVPLVAVFLYGSFNDTLFEAAYIGQVTWIALSVTFFYEIYALTKKNELKTKPAIKYIALFGVLMGLLHVGGVRALAEQIVPLLAAVAIMMYIEMYGDKNISILLYLKRAIKLIVILIVPAGIGFGIYVMLCSSHIVNSSAANQTIFLDTFASVWNGVWLTIQNFFVCFGYDGNVQLVSIEGIRNLVSATICVMICVVVPVLQAKKIKKEKESVQFFFYYAFVHNIIMLIMSVFLGKTNSSRYLLTMIFTLIMISARYIYEYWIKSKNIDKFLWTGLFLVATTVEIVGACASCTGWAEIVQQKRDFNQKILDHGLTKGYATYWNAYSNEVYSDEQIQYAGFYLEGKNRIKAHAWLVDNDCYQTKKDQKTFLMLAEEEKVTYEALLYENFGQPYEIFANQNFTVYCYNYDISEEFYNGCIDGKLMPKELNVSEGGDITKQRVKITPNGVASAVQKEQTAGTYRVTFVGKRAELGSCEFVSTTKQEAISWKEVKKEQNKLEVELKLSGKCEDIDFRLMNQSDSECVYLKKIVVKKVD